MIVRQDGVMRSYIGTGANEYRWAKYVSEEGTILYCLDLDMKWFGNGETASSVEVLHDNGLRYLLASGYPNVKLYDGGDIDRFITQAAVWKYQLSKAKRKLSEMPFDRDACFEAYTGIRDIISFLVCKARIADGFGVTNRLLRGLEHIDLSAYEVRVYNPIDSDKQRVAGLFEK